MGFSIELNISLKFYYNIFLSVTNKRVTQAAKRIMTTNFICCCFIGMLHNKYYNKCKWNSYNKYT